MTREEFIEKTLQHLGFTYVSPEQATLEFVFDKLEVSFREHYATRKHENEIYRAASERGYAVGMATASLCMERTHVKLDDLRQMTLGQISELIMEGE